MDTDRIKAALEGLVEGKKSGVFSCDCEADTTEELESKVEDARERWHKAEEALSLLSAPSPEGQEAMEAAENAFVSWWDATVKQGEWTTLERLAAHDAWMEMHARLQSALDAAVAGERERCVGILGEMRRGYSVGEYYSRMRVHESIDKAIDAIKEAKR